MSYSLLSPYEDPIFNSGVVKPFECLSLGWQLIKDQYFLFVGMCLIIVALVTCIPFTGIIYGAWMAGSTTRSWDECAASRPPSMR